MSRFLRLPSPEELPEEDPLSGIANLFDVSVVFIVGLMITLFSVYRMADLVDAQSEVTMVKTNAQGEREIIVKKGTKITAYKVSGKTTTGDGERLGTAYRLANEAVLAGDYRLALNRALESREFAQTAERLAAEGQASARDEALKTMADVSTQLAHLTEQLDAAEKSRSMSTTMMRDVRQALTLINADVQKAGTAINDEDYMAALEALKGVKLRLDTASGEIESARKAQRARRRTS